MYGSRFEGSWLEGSTYRILPKDSLNTSVVELTAVVAVLTPNHKSLQAAFEAQQQQQPSNCGKSSQRWQIVESHQRRNNVCCYSRNQMGHYAKACQRDTHCSLCFGWSHLRDQCANKYVQHIPTDTATKPSPTNCKS